MLDHINMRTKFRSFLQFVIVISLLGFLLPNQAVAQHASLTPLNEEQPPTPDSGSIHFDHLTSEDGLSSDIVWSVLQDSHGFIWIGTIDGLNRFDGYNFKVFKHDVSDPDSLGDSSVQVLVEDKENNLWLGSWGGGLNKFDPTTEQFTQYLHNPNDPNSLSSNRVQAIFEDDAGFIWVGTAAGLNRLDPSTDKFTQYKNDPNDPNSLSNNNVQALQGDHTGALWIGTNGGGLDRLDPEAGRFTHYKYDPADPNSISADNVWTLYEDRLGILWVGTLGGGLNQFDPNSGKFITYQHDPDDPNSLSENNIMSIVEDHDGVLWIGGRVTGLNRFDRDTGKFLRYPHVASNPHSLSHSGAVALYVDRVGSLWVGTNGGGLNILDRNRKPFSLFRHYPGDPDSLSNSDVRSIWEDQSGVLWVGTRSGLNRSDQGSSSTQFTLYPNDTTDPESLGFRSVLSIVEDGTGTLWFGTSDRGLDKFKPESGQFVRYTHDPGDPDSLSFNIVRALYVDRAETLWIGTFGGGLNRFDGETAQFVRYQHDPDDPNSLSDNTVMFITEDQFGDLWVGTLGGLNRMPNGKDEFIRYYHDPNDPSSLSHNSAVTIFEDQDGTLWIATNGGGINKFDRQNEQFIHYRAADGLASDTVMGITEDDQGYLWISTSQGLSRFDPPLGIFKNYDSSDGLQGNQFNFNAVFKSQGGELYFGGVNGFNMFDPSAIQDNPNIPPVVITELRLDNVPVKIGPDSVLQKSIHETQQLALSYLVEVISFEFSALNYTAPEKNSYRYILEGFDDDWVEVGSDRRFVTYTHLDPGQYTLRVIGSNNDGVWNEEGTSIAITITPPWWQTWWFLGIMTILVLGAVAGAFAWQNRNIRNQEQHLEKLLAERTTELSFIQSQMGILFENSPLGIGLATLEGDILSANKAMGDIFGYSEEEILQVNVLSYFKESEQRAEIEKRLEIEKTIQVAPLQLQRKDGSPFYASLTESRITWGDQDVLMGIVHDITDQVLAEEALKSEAERAAVTEERSRLARELHDSATQSLYSALLFSETGKRLTESGNIEGASHFQNRVSDVIYQALKEMRLLVFELQLPLLDQEGLVGALKFRLETVERRSGVEAHLDVDEFPSPPSEISLNLYRIILEALNNALKHAQADEVRVKLTADGDLIIVEVIDNGSGFDIHTIEDQAGLGLKNMRARAERLGGDLALETSLGKGTSVRFTMAYPLEQEETRTRLD